MNRIFVLLAIGLTACAAHQPALPTEVPLVHEFNGEQLTIKSLALDLRTNQNSLPIPDETPFFAAFTVKDRKQGLLEELGSTTLKYSLGKQTIASITLKPPTEMSLMAINRLALISECTEIHVESGSSLQIASVYWVIVTRTKTSYNWAYPLRVPEHRRFELFYARDAGQYHAKLNCAGKETPVDFQVAAGWNTLIVQSGKFQVVPGMGIQQGTGWIYWIEQI